MFHSSEQIITNLTLHFEVIMFFKELNSVEVTYRHVDDIQTLREMLCFGCVLLVHNHFHVCIHLLNRLNRPITVCILNILHSHNKLKVLSKIRLSGNFGLSEQFFKSPCARCLVKQGTTVHYYSNVRVVITPRYINLQTLLVLHVYPIFSYSNSSRCSIYQDCWKIQFTYIL